LWPNSSFIVATLGEPHSSLTGAMFGARAMACSCIGERTSGEEVGWVLAWLAAGPEGAVVAAESPTQGALV
jgi:hypothetical protein